jgi:SAM-dependent methyltransferase
MHNFVTKKMESESHLFSQPLYPETADIETASNDYAQRFSGKTGEYFLEVQTNISLKLLEPWPQARVLDVDGGHAQISVPLVQRGFDVTVTGSSELCRERLDRFLEPGTFQFRCCDMLELPFESNTFDIVLAFRLVSHVNRWRELLAEMCRVSREAVIIDYPDLRSFNFVSEQFFQAKKAIEGNTRPFRCFHRSELLDELAGHGFTRPTIRPEFFVPMAIHRVLRHVWFSKAMESCSRRIGLSRLFGSPVILRVVSEVDTMLELANNLP